MSGAVKDRSSFDIFLSIATADEAAGRRVEAFLEREGFRTFLAVSDLNEVVGTRQWSEALEGVLAECPVLVLLVSRAALDSKWVSFEWRSFHDDVLSNRRAGLLVPILLEEVGLEELPAALRHWQIIGDGAQDEAKAFTELLRLITSFRRATQGSSETLDQRLRWSLEPLSKSTPATDPPTPHGRTPERRRGAIALGVAAVAGALTMAAWKATPAPTPPPPVPRPAASASSKRPAPSTPPEPAPVWTLLHQYASPTPSTRPRLMRAETWAEAQSALERYCHEAALAPGKSAREGLEAARCTNRHLAALELVKGESSRLAGELEAAQGSLTAAKRLDPQWALPSLALAMVLTQKNPGQAREEARRAYDLDPALWLALSIKANAFFEQGNYVAATQELTEAVRVAPPESRPLAQGSLALAYHAEGLSETKATELARATCTSTLRVVTACTVLAEQALERRDPDEAIRVHDLVDRGDFVPLELALGDAWQMKRQLPKAWSAWRRAVSLAGRAAQEGTPRERMAAIERAVRTNVEPPPRVANRTQPGVGKTVHSRPSTGGIRLDELERR